MFVKMFATPTKVMVISVPLIEEGLVGINPTFKLKSTPRVQFFQDGKASRRRLAMCVYTVPVQSLGSLAWLQEPC